MRWLVAVAFGQTIIDAPLEPICAIIRRATIIQPLNRLLDGVYSAILKFEAES
jgi:hypothetical protein